MKKEAGFENRNPFVELGLVISVLKSQGLHPIQLEERAQISCSHLSSIEAPNISS